MKKACVLSYRLSAQPFCLFCHVAAQIFYRQIPRTGQTVQFCRLKLNFSSFCYFSASVAKWVSWCFRDQYSPCCKISGHDKTAKLNCAFSEYSDQLCISSTLPGTERSAKTPDKLDTQADLSSLVRTFGVCTTYLVRFYIGVSTLMVRQEAWKKFLVFASM